MRIVSDTSLAANERESSNQALARQRLSRLKIQPVDLRAQDKIALAQTFDLMGEDDDVDLPPGERQVRMVALFLGQFAHTIDEIEGLAEVRTQDQRSS